MNGKQGGKTELRPSESPREVSTPVLVYVVGHHKSGSTVLGALLSGSPDIFFAGELYRFPSPIWVPGDPNRYCSCGAPSINCPFWSHVRQEFERQHRLDELRRGQLRFERWRDLPRTLFARGSQRQELQRHAGRMEDLVRIIGQESGARVIVESGFGALRGRVYSVKRNPPFRVKFLHLVRDGRGFMWSESHQENTPEAGGPWVRFPPIVVARWVGMNLLGTVLCSQDRANYLRVRYEDLVENPRATLERIGRFVGVDLTEVIARVEAKDPIPMRHITAGNRNRLGGSVVLKADLSWTTGLPQSSRALFWLTGGWLARLYGYRRRADA
ncbi:MAG: sulfotransferase domain-containing protein [Thermoplasmata archaeon]